MKVALCFYGLVGSKVDKNGHGQTLNPRIAFELNKKNIIKKNDTDIFIHSWSSKVKEELEELYQPKVSIIEEQMDFSNSFSLIHNVDLKQRIKEIVLKVFNNKRYQELIENRKKEAFRACSRWYSSQKAIDLKAAYEKENNFKYDVVIILRLDVGFYTPLVLHDYDLDKFYASHWNDYPSKKNNYEMNLENHNLGRGFLDFWFFSNSENMDKFSKLYESIEQFHVSPHRSSYQYAKQLGFDIAYTLYRWKDHEMIRRKEFGSKK